MNLLLIPLLVSMHLFLEPVVAPEARYGKNFVFVVDVSGSMCGKTIASAIAAFLCVAEQPLDDGAFTILAFSDGVSPWSEGWQKLPSREAVERARGWLSSISPDGDTQVLPALYRAFETDRKELSIVVITDGDFNEPTEFLVRLLNVYQARRIERGQGPAVLGAIGIHWQEKRDSLAALADFGKGGYFRFTD